MNKFKKLLPLIIAICFFIGFGTYHITKFETIDEHFWKYDRIKQYYAGLSEGFSSNNWKKTRINDKPGVTVALISGLGLPFMPDPHTHRDLERENKYIFPTQKSPTDKIKDRKMYVLYDIEKTPSINLGLRLPILLFNGLIMLPIFFWLLLRAFNWKIASLSIIFIGLNPILIGMSQIPNPDSLLWSLSAAAIFSFAALLKTEEKKFIFLTGLFTGLALLSKYTANLLFIFYPIMFLLYEYFAQNNTDIPSKDLKWIKNYISKCATKFCPKFHKKYNLLEKPLFNTFLKYAIPVSLITLLSWIVLVIFMPAVIQAPKHFLYATVYSPVIAPLNDIFIDLFHIKKYLFISKGKYLTDRMAIFSITIFGFLFIILPPIILVLLKKFHKTFIFLLKTIVIAFILMFALSMLNAWTGTPIFDLTDLKEVSREGGDAVFPQFQNDIAPVFYAKAFLVQSQNFVFSLNPIVVIFVLLTSVFLVLNKTRSNTWILYFLIITPFVFFLGAILSKVFVNVRYSIMLYPIFSLFAAIGVLEFLKLINITKIKSLHNNKLLILTVTAMISAHAVSLYTIKPFFFNYTSSLLPKKYVVTDAWGYGFYEAAQYLNTLTDAENLVVWLDRSGVCQFFTGKCIASREVYLNHTDVDYLVITRRGSIIKRPQPIPSESDNIFTKKDYYSEESLSNPAWEVNIDDRPGNFVKIIKIEK